jgi:hypothetical protein
MATCTPSGRRRPRLRSAVPITLLTAMIGTPMQRTANGAPGVGVLGSDDMWKCDWHDRGGGQGERDRDEEGDAENSTRRLDNGIEPGLGREAWEQCGRHRVRDHEHPERDAGRDAERRRLI